MLCNKFSSHSLSHKKGLPACEIAFPPNSISTFIPSPLISPLLFHPQPSSSSSYAGEMLLDSVYEYAKYGIPVFLVIAFLLFFALIDCDITLWCYHHFGKSPKCLKGKVVWITGSSSGIGEQLAYQFASLGCKLVICGTRGHRLENVKRNCLVKNADLTDNDIIALVFDMREVDKIPFFVENVITRFGRIDILVNNAGRSQRAMFQETTLPVDREMFEVNVFSMIQLTRVVVNHWYEKNIGGQIIVTSSIAGKLGAPYSSTYTATKHALHGYFEALRNESYSRGIRISMACPGPVVSEITETAYTSRLEEKWGKKHAADNKRMPTERCAVLMMSCIANQLDEVWICEQPFLAGYYATQYLPTVTRTLMPRIMTKERIMRLRDGEDALK